MMSQRVRVRYLLCLAATGLLATAVGCTSGAQQDIPITTSSEEAQDLFVQGRDMAEKLREQEARQLFDRAIEADSNFALAYLYRAMVRLNTQEFLRYMDRALALADQVTEGERLQIEAMKAAIDGDPMRQRELYMQLAEAFPQSARAHNLLAGSYFGQQEYPQAIAEYEIATRLDSSFSQAYNQLGYAYRFRGDYDAAEQAFKKYIELIPDDPNPYDSYADLLLKMGRFDAAIEQFRQSLRHDPNFIASHLGIAACLDLKGEHEAARSQLQQAYDIARYDGERRAALYGQVVSYVDEGKTDSALHVLEQRGMLAEAAGDGSALAENLTLTGDVLYESGRFDQALAKYEEATDLILHSDLSQEIKDNQEHVHFYYLAAVALKQGQIDKARAYAAEYIKRAKAKRNLNQIRYGHQLTGLIALEEEDYAQALAEFGEASQLNPYNLYRMALAHLGLGNLDKARELARKAAEFNVAGRMNYAFVRAKALRLLETL